MHSYSYGLDTSLLLGCSSIVEPRDRHYRGEALFETYYGNKTAGGGGAPDPPTADTIYGIGSVTKVFPVIQLFMLYERGVARFRRPPYEYDRL